MKYLGDYPLQKDTHTQDNTLTPYYNITQSIQLQKYQYLRDIPSKGTYTQENSIILLHYYSSISTPNLKYLGDFSLQEGTHTQENIPLSHYN